jgi:hypothetical protein
LFDVNPNAGSTSLVRVKSLFVFQGLHRATKSVNKGTPPSSRPKARTFVREKQRDEDSAVVPNQPLPTLLIDQSVLGGHASRSRKKTGSDKIDEKYLVVSGQARRMTSQKLLELRHTILEKRIVLRDLKEAPRRLNRLKSLVHGDMGANGQRFGQRVARRTRPGRVQSKERLSWLA